MAISVYGLNHKSASIDIREKVNFSLEQQIILLNRLLEVPAVQQAVVLATCNRTEIYIDQENTEAVLALLSEFSGLEVSELREVLYCHHGVKAVEHIMSVACGLDSLVVGESQILGQLKQAVIQANEYSALGAEFHTLFQRVFALAKRVRTTTEIGACPVSIASIAIQLMRQHLHTLTDKQVMLVGAGSTVKLAARYLKDQQVEGMIFANRDYEKAVILAGEFGGKAIPLQELGQYLPQVDAVFSATASERPILGKGAVESAMKLRHNKPMLLLDMAVPRDIEPEVVEISGIVLRCIDDLKDIAGQHVKSREHAAEKVKKVVCEQAHEFWQWYTQQDALQLIRLFREQVGAMRDQEVEKATRLLQQGIDPQLVLQRLAHAVTNKLLHEPSVQMRQACLQGKVEFLQTVKDLFALDDGEARQG